MNCRSRLLMCTVLLGLAGHVAAQGLQTFTTESVLSSADVEVNSIACILPCSVRYSDPNRALRHVQFMAVQWSAKLERGSSYHRLADSNYWHRQNVSFAAHTIERCTLKSVDGEVLVLDCGLVLRSCHLDTHEHYLGDYKCEIHHRITLANYVSEPILTRKRVDTHGEPIPFPCHFPRAMDINATVFTAQDNVTKRINVTWTFDRRPRDQEYCHRSRQWSIRVLTFDSLEGIMDHDTRNHDSLLQFRPTERLRYLHFEVEEPLQRDKYYLFQLQNQRPVGERAIDVRKRNYSSLIFFFGDQTIPQFTHTGESERTVQLGEDIEIMCAATGFPRPTIKFIRHGRDVQLINNRYRLRQVTQEDEGDYYCSASNDHVGPPNGRRRQTVNTKFTIMIQGKTDRVCINYNGAMCRSYIHTATRVFVNITDPEIEVSRSLGHIGVFSASHHDNVRSGKYTGITTEDISECYQFVRSITCNSAYRYCDIHSNETNSIPRPICKHSCDELRQGGHCGFFLSADLLTEHQYMLSMFRDQLFANCDTRVNPAGDSPECIYVSYESPTIAGGGDDLQRSQCVEGNGRGYSGDYEHTESGLVCQSWFSQSPNKHSLVHSRFSGELYGAGFACRNPGGLGERPWCYVASHGSTKRWEYCNVPSCKVCVQYEEQFCASVPGYSNRTVYIDRVGQGLITVQDIESDMTLLYHGLTNEDLSAGCEHALRVLICHGALPFCTSHGSPSPLKGCRDHCSMFEELQQHCPANIASTLQSIWTSNRLAEPDCTVETHSQQCMPAPQRLSMSTSAHEECYNQTHSYTGDVAVTADGVTCKNWAQTTYTSQLYPELTDVTNQCRNPGQWQSVPWCITTAEGQIGLCAVDSCDDKSPSALTADNSVVWAVLLAIAAVVILLAVGLGMYGLIRRSYKNRHATISSSPPALVPCNNNALRNVKFMENNQYNMIAVQQPLPPKVTEAIMSFHQISQESIEYIKQLGQGFFGMVFKGKLKNDLDEEVFVAVKTLKEDSNDGIELFVNEAKLMFGFDHENIVKILGVSMTKTPFYLIFEYMDRGDLAKFLRDSASSEQRRHMNPCDRPRSRTESTISDDPASLTIEQLTDICKQIAKGMEYLASMNHVHRDLACRNCLVQSVPEDVTSVPSRVIVKIGDFGLSHNLYSKDYYRVKGQAVLPIRWMSPEAIIYGKFSTAGDVWSFGVVMWEIFTFGMQPYYGTSNEEVMERVRHGRVLNKPPDCSGRMYTIMTECWQTDEYARPNFTTILQYLNECRGSTSSEEDCRSSHYSSDESLSDVFDEENSDTEGETSITGRVD